MGWRRIAAAVTRPVDLGGPLGVTRSGVAYVVDQLRAKGLIARHTGEVPGDRRAVVLTMTDPGRAEVAEVCVDSSHPMATRFGVRGGARSKGSAARPAGVATP